MRRDKGAPRMRTGGDVPMAAYFVCLTAGGGVPLFSRNRGKLKPLPFPVIGSLNGVHMFGSNHGVQLLSTSTVNSKVVWKLCHNSLTLIIASGDDGASDSHLTSILDYIFQAMVLLYGLDELTNIKNVDRFKREIKICFSLIDCLLGQSESSLFGSVTRSVDVLAAQENAILQAYLDAFADAANSPYGCLLVQGRVAVATTNWWSLPPVERVLLSLLLHSMPKCSSRDLPVFLPVTSPTVPHRLLTYQLIQGVDVCVICGPAPSLAELQTEVDRFWRSSLDSLKSVAAVYPRNLPANLQLDHNILGLLLVNTETQRCLNSVHLQTEDSNRSDLTKTFDAEGRREALQSFYRKVVGNLYPSPLIDGDEPTETNDLSETLLHPVMDTYICTDTHKCYVHQMAAHQLFLLFNPNIPTFAMRSVAQKTLQLLIRDKCVQV